ncbi:unnamed protein product [Orchesella dallaii]|uniref:Odorant receptor n=1 Tax=Orchesella dallaii TaxID=48710 RepID=A0ABP1S7S2_9HEXA
METSLNWKAFELYDIAFFYMYPGLLHMNPEERIITKHKPNWKLAPWFFIQIFGISLSSLLTLVIILRETTYPTGRFSVMELTIFITMLSTMILILGFCLVPILVPENVSILNEMFQWEKKLELDFPHQFAEIREEDSKKVNLIGLILCSSTCLLSLFPFPVMLFTAIFNIDQFNYVFEEFLPSPMERETVDHILIPMLARVSLIGVQMFEGSRTLVNSFNLMACYVYSVTCGLRILGKIRNAKEFIPRYRQIQMLCMLNKGPAGFMGALLICVGQVATTVLLWMTINGYELVPTVLMYVLFPVGALGAICFTIIMFEQSIAIYELTDGLVVKTWRIGCVTRLIVDERRELLISREIKRVARSLKPFAMTVGPIRPIKKGFQIEYLDLLMSNLTNALLLI